MDESDPAHDRHYIWGVVHNRQQGKCNSKECAIYLQQAESTVLRLREGRGRPTVFNGEGEFANHVQPNIFSSISEKYEILCGACHENMKPHRVNFKVHPDIFASWTGWKNTHKPDATLTSVILLAMDKLVNRDEWANQETWERQKTEAKAAQYDRLVQIIEQNIEDIAYEELNDRAGTNIDADLE